jgi:hypothetical protein
MSKMTNEEFEVALKQFPCPDCGEIGHLTTQQMKFDLIHKGLPVVAEGEAWICQDGCNHIFMSDALTEEFANKTNAIDADASDDYIAVDRKTGNITIHPIH